MLNYYNLYNKLLNLKEVTAILDTVYCIQQFELGVGCLRVILTAIFIVIDGVHDFVSPISNHNVYLYQYIRNHREKKSTATGSQLLELDAPNTNPT